MTAPARQPLTSRTGDRIAVTGLGLVSALGAGADVSFRRLCAGERALAPATLFETAGYRSELAAEVRDLRVRDVAPRGSDGHWSRSDALALLAAREALTQAGFGASAADFALAIGASTGGMYEVEPALVAARAANGPHPGERGLAAYPVSNSARLIGAVLGAGARRVTVCSACSSSAAAIALAAAWIREGSSHRVLAGGTDGLCRLTFAGFNALGATDPAGCRPFDARRAGLTLGEGAAFLVLEAEAAALARGAHVLGWLSGWALAAEAHHITQPEPSGATAARLLAEAMRRAGLRPADVDYVNLHGTGTVHNDAMETRAIHAAFEADARRVLVSSSKGQLGHTLAAAGAVEAALTVLALSRGLVPPTGGLEQPDPALDLEHVRDTARSVPIRAALSSSFGFGGAGAVLAFERVDSASRDVPHPRPGGLVVTGAACWGARGLRAGLGCADYAAPEESSVASCDDALAQLDAERSRRFDLSSALVTAGSAAAASAAGLQPGGLGLVAGSSFGAARRSADFLARLFTRGPRFVSPADFPHLVPSAPAANASVYSGYSGPVLTVSALHASSELALDVACTLIGDGQADAVIAGAAMERDELVDDLLAPACTGENAPRGQGAGFVAIEGEAHARARGARVLAWVVGHGTLAEGAQPRGAVASGRGVLVCSGRSPGLRAALERTDWLKVPCVELGLGACSDDAWGAAAVAIAAALLGTGRFERALVVAEAPDALRFFELGHADA